MRKLLFYFILFFISFISKGQVSVFLAPGIMNYAGDMEPRSIILSHVNFSISAGVNYQLSDHFSISSGLTHGRVEGDDKFYKRNKKRNLNFKSNISEANLSIEYNLLSLSSYKLTPYLLAGFGVYHFNPYTYTDSNIKIFLQPLGTEGQGLPEYPERKIYKLTQANYIFGGGFKYKVSEHVTLGAAFASRLLFTDYLDDVSTTYAKKSALLNGKGLLAVELAFRSDEINPNAKYKDGGIRGNASAKDNYYTGEFKFIYKLSYANSSRAFMGKNWGEITCPKNIH